MACTEIFMNSSVSGEGGLFYENLFHVVIETEQREIICNNLRLIPSDEVQTVFGLSPSLFSHFHRFRRAAESASFPPGEAKGGLYGFASVLPKWYSAYRRKPLRRDAPPPLSGEIARIISSAPAIPIPGSRRRRRGRRCFADTGCPFAGRKESYAARCWCRRRPAGGRRGRRP